MRRSSASRAAGLRPGLVAAMLYPVWPAPQILRETGCAVGAVLTSDLDSGAGLAPVAGRTPPVPSRGGSGIRRRPLGSGVRPPVSRATASFVPKPLARRSAPLRDAPREVGDAWMAFPRPLRNDPERLARGQRPTFRSDVSTRWTSLGGWEVDTMADRM